MLTPDPNASITSCFVPRFADVLVVPSFLPGRRQPQDCGGRHGPSGQGEAPNVLYHSPGESDCELVLVSCGVAAWMSCVWLQNFSEQALGMNLGAVSRIQINIMVRTSPYVTHLKRFEDGTIIPVAWIETVSEETKKKKKSFPLSHDNVWNAFFICTVMFVAECERFPWRHQESGVSCDFHTPNSGERDDVRLSYPDSPPCQHFSLYCNTMWNKTAQRTPHPSYQTIVIPVVIENKCSTAKLLNCFGFKLLIRCPLYLLLYEYLSRESNQESSEKIWLANCLMK